MNALRTLIAGGLRVDSDERQRLLLSPRRLITDELRALARANKAEILAELDAAHRLAVHIVAKASKLGGTATVSEQRHVP